MATPKKKPVKKRSDEGRSVRQEDRRRTVAGKGFVGKSLTKREEKKVTKDLKKVAPYAIPGGLAAKGATSLVKAATKASGARKSGRAAVATSKAAGPSRPVGVKRSGSQIDSAYKNAIAQRNKLRPGKKRDFWENQIEKYLKQMGY
jgi:hypothetical protein